MTLSGDKGGVGVVIKIQEARPRLAWLSELGVILQSERMPV